jgi:hypothetical protein
MDGQLKSALHAHTHEKRTHYHKTEWLRAEIVDLETKAEPQICEESEGLHQDADERDPIQKTIAQALTYSALPLNEFLATGAAKFVLQSSPAAPITLRAPPQSATQVLSGHFYRLHCFSVPLDPRAFSLLNQHLIS